MKKQLLYIITSSDSKDDWRRLKSNDIPLWPEEEWECVEIEPRYGWWLEFRDYADSSLDCIAAFHVLDHYHIDERTQFIASCYRMLKPDGTFYVAVNNLSYPPLVEAMRTGDLDAVMYESRAGKVTAEQFLYGFWDDSDGSPTAIWDKIKHGFSEKTLKALLAQTFAQATCWTNGTWLCCKASGVKNAAPDWKPPFGGYRKELYMDRMQNEKEILDTLSAANDTERGKE
jgi:SAM-dependent methyltransferase